MDKLINYQKPAEARLFALLLTFSGRFYIYQMWANDGGGPNR